MRDLFSIDHYGKQNIVSRYGLCDSCRKLTVLSSYTTGKFIALRQFPLIPFGKKTHIINECPHCGHRGSTSLRKYRKQRTKDLAVMMEGFTSDPDNPDSALNGLHTLMVYDEESWFMDVEQSYGRRFETHLQIQLKIAEGLCRFGHYAEASTYCRKAIVLGGEPRGEELLALCQARIEKTETSNMELLAPQPESMLRPYAFMTAVTATLFITLIANGISAMCNHTIWLVNGAPIPYSVEIDGNRYPLKPCEEKCIKVRLGEHQMQTHGLPGRTLPISFSYKTSLLRQKLGNHALVLNPDAMAVMVEETLLEGQKTNRYQFGKVINALEGIDYPFSAFPVWAGTKQSAQTRLFSHTSTNHLELVELLRTHSEPTATADYARRALIVDPSGAETEELLKIATNDLSMEQTLVFLKRGTSILPPLPTWHLFYQDFMEARQPEHDLQTEYAMLCKAHPDMSIFYYLVGRVARNHATAQKFFEKSEKGGGSHGMGYHAIAYDQFCSGQFKEALAYSGKALKQSPDNPQFMDLDQQIHLALNQYAIPLHQIQNHLAEDPNNGEWVAKKIKYLTLSGDHTAATEAMNGFPDENKNWNAYFSAARFYVVGNTTDYLENLLAANIGNAEFQQLLHAGKVEAAHHLLSQNEDYEYTEHLILYCAAKRYEHPDIAETELAKAIAKIDKSTSAHRQEAAILASQTPPSNKQVLELRIPPQEKAILYTTLGFKFPEQYQPFFKLAGKFNHTPEYPQLLLKKWTRKAPAQ